MNVQGNSSLLFMKKNASVDIFDSEHDGDAFKVKFGNWVPQDSFHFKALYQDFFKGCSFIVYQIADDIAKTHGIMEDRPWKKALIGSYTETGQNGKQIDDISLQIDNGARCMPDGFPCVCYLNGEFYGIYVMALKKHRDNYHMKKNKAKQIHIDGSDWMLFHGTVNWNNMEIRNPKDSEMRCTIWNADKGDYEKYSEGMELLGSDAEHYDATNKSHVLSNEVKNYIINLSNRLPTASTLQTDVEKKEYLEQYFDIDSILDYIIVATATNETDGGSANWQWITYDGKKWFICNYDKDRSFGMDGNNFINQAITEGRWMFENEITLNTFAELYSTELKIKWKEYVEKGILTYEHFISKFEDWVNRIGQSNYEKEYNKWQESPCCRDNYVNSSYWNVISSASIWESYMKYPKGKCVHMNNRVYKALLKSKGVPVTNTTYWEDITYDSSASYAIGDFCGFEMLGEFFEFEAITENTNKVPLTNHYNNLPKVMGYRDNIWRVSNYIKQTLEKMNEFVNQN
jgi:hypothetical protein